MKTPPPGIWLLPLFCLFASLLCAEAQQPDAHAEKAEDDGPEVVFFRRMPPSSFMFNDGIVADHPGMVPVKKWPGKEKVFDVHEFLKVNGIKDTVSGFYFEEHRLLLLIGPRDQVDLGDRITESCCLPGSSKQIEITANLWRYVADQDLPPPVNLAEIRKHAGKSLRLVDGQTLYTPSGNRTLGTWLIPQANQSRATAMEAAKEKEGLDLGGGIKAGTVDGSYLEVEPIIRPEGDAVDMQLAYYFHLGARANVEAQHIEMSTTLSIPDGADRVGYSAVQSGVNEARTDGKVPRYALQIRTRILYPNGTLQVDAWEKEKKFRDELTKKVRAYLKKHPRGEKGR